MLALDFDGVVADALTECAAVTWYAGPGHRNEAVPGLPEALGQIPEAFLATFAQVRAYCRTMDDFMVTHALYPTVRQIDRATFEKARVTSDPVALSARAAAAEKVRSTWRERQFTAWVGLHTIRPEMASLIQETAHSVVVVSAKDRDSIQAVLAHHGLNERVSLIIGSCHDKRAALAALLETNREARTQGLIFIDDSITNVLAVTDLALCPLWALWGHHGPEDGQVAVTHGVQPLYLRQLPDLTQLPTPHQPDRKESP